ncbi:CAAX protease [Burkholderia singularis]|uniref:CAAX protease n=1 Tax=Burkholderia singularis TaxID=1503053 RepID=A0A103E4T2_9BURK|nr:CPBP family intramembrane glutamic endopeptidase [Burkholderia singularis]KVE28392.1 CAAX protease [Burkholderia singularis]
MTGNPFWFAAVWAALFAAAFAAVWLGPKLRSASIGLGALAYAGALATGMLAPVALAPIALLMAAAYAVAPERSLPVRYAGHALFAVLAVALMLHWLPGFHNPRVIDPVRFTPDAVPFSMYLNLDKPLVGFWLLWVLPWLRSDERCARTWRVGIGAAVATSAACLVFALGVGLVGWSPKWPTSGWLWFANNLLLVCFAEEALFRGYLQGGLSRLLANRVRGGHVWALAIAALLFGAAHAAGGWQWIVLSATAGVGYGLAYRAGGLRAAILAHIGLNVVHFGLFTYPMLAAAA